MLFEHEMNTCGAHFGLSSHAKRTCVFSIQYPDLSEQVYIKRKHPEVSLSYLGVLLYLTFNSGVYLTSSKTTLTDYQCVSTGCCTHVAKTEIAIDNQSCYKHHYKGTDFSPNNQKKTQKKSRTCYVILILIDHTILKRHSKTPQRFEHHFYNCRLGYFQLPED